MKKLAKNIVLMLTALFLISMATSCKKEEPAPAVNFNNPTAQYIESFLGKPVDEFIKACEESGMMKSSERESYISYSNQINGIEASCIQKNNIIINIEYGKKSFDKKQYIEFINYISNNNYAAFKGWNNGDTKQCYKNFDEYKKSIETEITHSACAFIKTKNGGFLELKSYPYEQLSIIFCLPDDTESYEGYKYYAMSSCD